jgi:two-component system LytT family response regulator
MESKTTDSMTKIRAAIIDDEPFARERVLRMLADEAEIEVVGQAGDGIEAVSMIKAIRPELIFLDVQMPCKDGFEVLAELAPEETPVVIFLTAFDRFAVKAFETAALDYLLKPFDEERLQKALGRAKTQLQNQSEPVAGQIFKGGQGRLERVMIKKGGRVFFFKTDEIEWIEANGNYVRLHFENSTHLLRDTMASHETDLDPQKFLRVHRSGLINLERIREMAPLFGGRAKIILAGGAEITASRRYYRKLTNLLEKP